MQNLSIRRLAVPPPPPPLSTLRKRVCLTRKDADPSCGGEGLSSKREDLSSRSRVQRIGLVFVRRWKPSGARRSDRRTPRRATSSKAAATRRAEFSFSTGWAGEGHILGWRGVLSGEGISICLPARATHDARCFGTGFQGARRRCDR